eukprot:TRINITY_DN11697_c1_g1_i1.p1 TRINITY_DN11697_c1_g1~~TRINITY_DN11697_c1_g1_i1.p1  ORF type:complete len:732 (-),score=231.23 TRINITY_DN11697_c1_g1_i1:200-2092(-)
MADEAVSIGGTKSTESYLRGDKILEAAKKTGADAIHPGYGFLSENAHFVEEVTKEGITFIGPPPNAMRALGEKINSKQIAKNAGVSIVPGWVGAIENNDHLLKLANEIGYPVMIKASSGGGGKGQRIAWNDKEAIEGFRFARQEAQSAFASDAILVEKYIQAPRHIEFQVLADNHGNVIYLPERECSIQRRNQKVIEEAPSPFITPEVRKKMGEQAASLARAVGYRNTGTVEFLIEPNHNFYFLEMNTRLQVEHPITEAVTGIDIVEQMIRVAAGQPLSYKQSDVKINGWAMESRVYAEDPLRNFLPSIGRLTRYKEPRAFDGGNWIRIDSGIVEGSEISIYYDPLISKLITTGEDRNTAINRMAYALDSYVVRGLNHNVCFLRDVMENRKFKSGELSTAFIPQEYPEGFKGHVLKEAERKQLVTVTAAVHHLLEVRNRSVSGKLSSFDATPENGTYVVRIGKAADAYTENVNVTALPDRRLRVNGITVDLSAWQLDGPVVLAHIETGNGQVEEVTLQLYEKLDLGYKVQLTGTLYDMQVMNPKEAELTKYMPVSAAVDTTKVVTSPMAGQLISVAVEVGQQVAMGQEICVVEAMKMQNVLRAQRDGVIKAIKAEAGKPVQLDQIIVELA